jgi:hypothetical protein
VKQESNDLQGNGNTGSEMGWGSAIELATGAGLGVALGTTMGDVAHGIPIGVGCGLRIGVAIGTGPERRHRENVSSQ